MCYITSKPIYDYFIYLYVFYLTMYTVVKQKCSDHTKIYFEFFWKCPLNPKTGCPVQLQCPHWFWIRLYTSSACLKADHLVPLSSTFSVYSIPKDPKQESPPTTLSRSKSSSITRLHIRGRPPNGWCYQCHVLELLNPF